MRLSFVASLLFSGSIGFFQLASAKTSIRQTALQHYNAQQGEVLQRGKKQIRQLLSQGAQAQSADAKRELQFTDAPTGAPLCNADGSVNFESEDFPSPEAYGSAYSSTCTCTEDNNAKEISDGLAALDFTNLTAYVEGFNTLLGMVYNYLSYECVNSCESCLASGVCGTLETAETYITEYTKSNFTIDEIGSGVFDDTPFITNFTYEFSECVTYTSGTSETGKLCLILDLDDPAEFLADETSCSIEYEGVPCNSCKLSYVNMQDCLTADCTNIDASGMIDSCNGTAYTGPFVFLEVYESDLTNSTFTIGSCDLSAPTAPVADPTAPVASPVAAPTAPAADPTAPVAAPVAAPTATAADPTAAPVASPTAPVATPTAPVAAPVKAPVKAPTAPTPPTAPSSGSFVIGLALNVLVLVVTVTYLA